MSTLTILRGLPGSGKSTWAAAHADKAAVVSLDALRRMASGSLKAWHARASREDTRAIVDAAYLMVDRFLSGNRNVIMDAQNLDPRGTDRLARIAARHGARVEYRTFRLPLSELLERNRTRPEPDRVPEAYLRHQYAAWDATLDREPTLLDAMQATPTVWVEPVPGELGVYACNFTRRAFARHKWDEYSSTARGLFLGKDGHVVARGFDKFFNIGETPETRLVNVLKRIGYPVRVERKMNGFLGLVSARGDGTLRYWTKSGQTDYSALVERLVGRFDTTALWQVARERDVTLLFEIIDHENDRHIISEPDSRAVFLHAVRNTRDFTLDPEADRLVRRVTGEPPLTVAVADTPGRLEAVIDREAGQPGVEGVVLYGADGYMAKVKTRFYLTVKSLRRPLEDILLNGRPAPAPHTERARLVRAVLDGMPRERLLYVKETDGRTAVDMEEVGLWLTEQTPVLV